LALTEL